MLPLTLMMGDWKRMEDIANISHQEISRRTTDQINANLVPDGGEKLERSILNHSKKLCIISPL